MGSMRLAARCALVLLLAAGASSRLQAQGAGWETFGPALFQVNALSTPAQNLTVYAASADPTSGASGIFGSTDGGNTWNALVNAPANEVYADILADGVDAGTLYAGAPDTGDGTTKIYRSINSGGSWLLGQTIPAYCVPSFAQLTTGDVLVSCGTFLYRGASDGTWAQLPNPFTEATRLTAGPNGVVLAFGPTRIFKSTNRGDSWTAVGQRPGGLSGLNALRINPGNATLLVAGTGVTGAHGFQCGGVYQSANGGATWSSTGLSGVYVTDVAINPDSPSQLFASAGYAPGILPVGGVFQSLDGGATWSDLALPQPGAGSIALSHDANLIYAATSLGVYQRNVEVTIPTAPRSRPILPPGSPPPRIVAERP